MCEEYTSNQGCVLRGLFGWHLYVQLCANMLQIAAHGWFARVQNVVEVFLLRSLFAGFPYVCTRGYWYLLIPTRYVMYVLYCSIVPGTYYEYELYVDRRATRGMAVNNMDTYYTRNGIGVGGKIKPGNEKLPIPLRQNASKCTGNPPSRSGVHSTESASNIPRNSREQ